jgi:agmatine deiminase
MTDCRYRWPAEWERHAATWLAWPHNRETWPHRYAGVPEQFAQLVEAIAGFEPVHILAGGATVMEQAAAYVGHINNVQLHDIVTNDAWIRDYGPVFVTRPDGKGLTILNWEYNAWGGKYPPWDDDNQVPQRVAQLLNCPTISPGIVLEGGSIDGDGQGTLVTTESCLLAPNRNPQLDRENLEDCLKDYLGADTVVWLPAGPLEGDDTDGHVDQVARFIAPGHIVTAMEEDTEDRNYAAIHRNLAVLRTLRAANGEPYQITTLPMPAAKRIQGRRLPASYCNFCFTNGGVVVPLFGDPQDQRAIELLQTAIPERQVVGAPADRLIWGLGAFHCLTQQQPEFRSRETPPSPPA